MKLRYLLVALVTAFTFVTFSVEEKTASAARCVQTSPRPYGFRTYPAGSGAVTIDIEVTSCHTVSSGSVQLTNTVTRANYFRGSASNRYTRIVTGGAYNAFSYTFTNLPTGNYSVYIAGFVQSANTRYVASQTIGTFRFIGNSSSSVGAPTTTIAPATIANGNSAAYQLCNGNLSCIIALSSTTTVKPNAPVATTAPAVTTLAPVTTTAPAVTTLAPVTTTTPIVTTLAPVTTTAPAKSITTVKPVVTAQPSPPTLLTESFSTSTLRGSYAKTLYKVTLRCSIGCTQLPTNISAKLCTRAGTSCFSTTLRSTGTNVVRDYSGSFTSGLTPDRAFRSAFLQPIIGSTLTNVYGIRTVIWTR